LEIYFATSNAHKFKEAEEILRKLAPGITLKHLDFKHNEIRSDSIEEVAEEAVEAAYLLCNKPVFVEDTGLFIGALNGFPGTYSAWVQKKLGNNGILKLLTGEKNRSAAFKACVAFKADAAPAKAFVGECKGKIAESERGSAGFGYDPLFIPNDEEQTFAENAALKNKRSHRYNSLLLLANHIAAMKHE
jgi:XTP/dITP diphosphohydrolase